jgi:lysophospholipase L1-like esterase
MTTVFYIGDSTVAYNNIHSYPQTGMSQGLRLYLSEQVRIVSLAKNGRSTKSFLDEGRFAPAIDELQSGDFLFIQFGHNDEKEDPARHTDPDTTFRENLRFFIREARKKGAYPVLITPIARRLFDGEGHFLPGSHGAYPEAIRQTGAEMGVPVADLTAMTEDFLAKTGDAGSKPLYMWPKDNTHLKPEGAVVMAGFLAEILHGLGGMYAALLAPDTEGAGK